MNKVIEKIENGRRLSLWLYPTIVIGLCSVAFAVGTFVGEARYLRVDVVDRINQIELADADIRGRQQSLEAVLSVELQGIRQRLDAIDRQLERIVRE